MRITVSTNMRRLEDTALPGVDFEFRIDASGRLLEVLRMFVRSFRCDYVLLNGAVRAGLLLAALKMCIPFHRPKLVLLDILLPAPRTGMGRAKARVIGFFLRRMHLIMLYYRDTSGLQKHFRVPANRFAYIPFKVNQPHLIERATPSDGGYVFCGGKTRRDFAVLFEAVRGTDWAVKVVTTENSDIAPHDSYLNDRDAPTNVEVVRLDGSPERFIYHMAASTLVVLPIKPDICGAGISVYIQAMALRKCVVLSAGPGASDVLTSGQAIIVPPGDPVALRESIGLALSDPAYRQGFERRGYDWATSLGGEEQLYTNLLSRLYEDYVASR